MNEKIESQKKNTLEREENLTRFWVETEDEFWVRVFSQIEKQKEGYL